jgi:hypothetical protein
VSFRVKKYLKLMSFGSRSMKVLAFCSKGRRMLTPKLRERPAPPCAASMIPPPPPVMAIHPRRVMRLAKARACSYSGAPASVRAEPKMDTLRIRRYGANTLKAYRSSFKTVFRTFRSPRLVSSRMHLSAFSTISRTSGASG